MKGMTIKQFSTVVGFVEDFHRFGNLGNVKENREKIKEVFPNMPDGGFHIKYIDSSYDSRTGTIWKVEFRGFGKTEFRTNMHVDEVSEDFKYDNLYDLCMDYLKGNYKPK